MVVVDVVVVGTTVGVVDDAGTVVAAVVVGAPVVVGVSVVDGPAVVSGGSVDVVVDVSGTSARWSAFSTPEGTRPTSPVRTMTDIRRATDFRVT